MGSSTAWSDITPSEKLVWHPCPGDGYAQCARLTVPMDYHRPLNESADNPKVHIALAMVPGVNRTAGDPASYSESPMLVNPGGPGGGGAGFALNAGRLLQGLVGDHHDIIGFDPRGVGATTPAANCFAAPDDGLGLDGHNIALINRLSWLLSGHEVGLINSSNVALGKIDVRARAMARLCKKIDDQEGEGSIFRYANTANVARDMLSIVHAWDEWRSSTLVTVPHAEEAPHQEPEAVDAAARLEESTGTVEPARSTKGKLVYWGFSYGTLLGATFASMFPDAVGRLVLDGVVDADHYVQPTWVDSLIDADAIWEAFFVYCHEAGQDCRLFRPGDDVDGIKRRFHDIMNRLQERPEIVIPLRPDENVPALVTAGDVKMVLFSSLYSPVAAFPFVAGLLDVIFEGSLNQTTFPPVLPMLCHNLSLPVWPDDSQLNEDVPALQERFEKMASYSSFADVWMGLNIGCDGWEIEAKDPPMRWGDHPAHKPAPIDTSFPILFLSSRRDPVTPLHAALKMTRKFAGASIVEQASDGHCTLSCVSLCTARHVRAYVNDGVLPPSPRFDSGDKDKGEWTTCECDEKPWSSFGGRVGPTEQDRLTTAADDAHTLEELEIMASYHGLRNHFVAQTASRLVDELNPLRSLIVDMPSRLSREPQTCSLRSPN
ncbi:hypothetical protein DL766_005844 [Monosporascus sp. MC13-8B]|uniref:Peptidase S33 tripeptidyl aminopeptidase-like C-terminal domain-containing protein n=1 Tax=Monosporascus cannonballus TaxID=155416 RepID=A0ABY0H6K7_9PEZI|nr:hypothetical protein DL762_005994 [Monosporascus cannonballus]RYO83966.1 hypothetical protein DL763_007644 [Monosporascus cannonballus]RYP28492.1 hypothetical protein DL766_005844 [Monosporascus sp. MC13-8B]